MKTLVTGGAGFVGSHLVDRLLADGHDVAVVDDLSTGTMANLESALESTSCRFEQLDVTTPAFAAVVGEVEPEVIFHLAAQIDVRASVADPLNDARLNILGTINVCEAARLTGTRKVVFTSSGGTIYGSPSPLPAAESVPVNPLSPYAVSKVSGELYLAAYLEMYGLDWTSLAFANIYGPRQNPHGEAGVVAIFGTAMLEGRPTKIYGDGTATRDYIYIDDAIEAFVLAADGGEGRRLNIGSGIEMSVLELHGIVAAAAEAPDEPVLAPPRTGELQAISLDATAAAAELGWVPAVDFVSGVARTIDWLRTTVAMPGYRAGSSGL